MVTQRKPSSIVLSILNHQSLYFPQSCVYLQSFVCRNTCKLQKLVRIGSRQQHLFDLELKLNCDEKRELMISK